MKINEFFYHLQGADDFVTHNHTHDEIELIECVSGSGSVLKSDCSYPLKERFLYLIDARRPHIVYPTDCENYIRNKIVIDAGSFMEFLRAAGLEDSVDRLLSSPPVPTHPHIDQLFETIVALCRSGQTEAAGFAHGYILQLLHFAAMGSTSGSPASAKDDFVGKALAVIAETDGLTSLQDLSRRLNLSKYYLCRLFKARTGITLSEYIAEKRCETGLRLLRTTTLSVEAIAVRCGFSSAASFTRFFRRRHGTPPSACRRS